MKRIIPKLYSLQQHRSFSLTSRLFNAVKYQTPISSGDPKHTIAGIDAPQGSGPIFTDAEQTGSADASAFDIKNRSAHATMKAARVFFNEHYETGQDAVESNDADWDLVSPAEMKKEFGRPLNSSDFAPREELGCSRAYSVMKKLVAQKKQATK
jgi:hypothetical protein